MYKKLSEIKVGSTAIIRSLEGLDIKLMEMGCIPGEIVKIDNIAPFKDPISITVAGYQLSLRIEEAENIIVEEIL